MRQFERLKKRRLGEILVDEGYITQEQLETALSLQKEGGELLGRILIEQGYLTERALARAMANQLGLPFLSTENYQLSKEVVGLIPNEICFKYELIPLDRFGKTLTILMAGMVTVEVVETIQQLTGCDVFIYIGTSSDVQQALREWVSPSAMTQADISVSSASWMSWFDKADQEVRTSTSADGDGVRGDQDEETPPRTFAEAGG